MTAIVAAERQYHMSYVLEGPEWDSGPITWSFAAFNYAVDAANPFSSWITGVYQSVVEQAIQAWASVSGLAFEQVPDSSDPSTADDIRIGFATFNPASSGDIGETNYSYTGGHFNQDVIVRLEDPSQDPLISTSAGLTYQGHQSTLYQVALHELGHALGLGHSPDPHAVMYPVATSQNGNLDASDIAGIQALYAPGLSVVDTTMDQPVSASMEAYSGPVQNLQNEYINVTSDSLNIGVSTDNWFIHSGAGTDAITVHGGTNVLDGGTSSNFLTGGNGTDTFFVDDRNPTADIWSTVVGFHAGDAATIWGVTQQDFTLTWVDNQGAAGFTGLTLHATAAGKPTASLTLAGYSQADMASGRISVSFGSDPVSGSSYMYVHGNS
jgi:predicted Zn-dependent protease